MGFCLLEQASAGNIFFAVNPSYVSAVDARGQKDERPICSIKFNQDIERFDATAFGEKTEIEALLQQALKIGFQQADLNILSGTRHVRPQPFLMSHAQRVVIAHEIHPAELGQTDGSFVTASKLCLEGEKPRFIVERPGVFAARANAGGVVPRF